METTATNLPDSYETAPSAASAPAQSAAAAAPFGSVIPPVPVQISPPAMVAVRRRRSGSRGKRSGRSKADKLETPQRRAYLGLLCFVLLLMAIAAVKGIRQTVYTWLHSISPALEKAGVGLEVIALVLAGLVLVYLMPGMEERILRLVGLRRDKRR